MQADKLEIKLTTLGSLELSKGQYSSSLEKIKIDIGYRPLQIGNWSHPMQNSMPFGNRRSVMVAQAGSRGIPEEAPCNLLIIPQNK
jgi:hypothetical protein